MEIKLDSWIAIVGVLATIGSVFLAQWLASRKARADARADKLEQLIVALAEARTFNGDRFRTARAMALKAPPVTGDPTEYVHYSRDMPLEGRIGILVKDHFPELVARNRDLREKARPMVEMFHRFSEGKRVRVPETLAVFMDVGESLDLFEEEIRENREALLKGKRAKYTALPDKPTMYNDGLRPAAESADGDGSDDDVEADEELLGDPVPPRR